MLHLALGERGEAQFLVTGDKPMLDLRRHKSTGIVTSAVLLHCLRKIARDGLVAPRQPPDVDQIAEHRRARLLARRELPSSGLNNRRTARSWRHPHRRLASFRSASCGRGFSSSTFRFHQAFSAWRRRGYGGRSSPCRSSPPRRVCAWFRRP